MKRSRRRIDFAKINRAAFGVLRSRLEQLLPHRVRWKDVVAGNPYRDRSHSAVAPK
jgi:hypothetical protein